jgi:hypothetical protein
MLGREVQCPARKEKAVLQKAEGIRERGQCSDVTEKADPKIA